MSSPALHFAGIPARGLLVATVLLSTRAGAAENAEAPTAEQLNSNLWWLDLAASYAKDVPDVPAKAGLYWNLAYAQGWADDLEGAATSASLVADPYRSVTAYSFVAHRYHERGDAKGCRQALHEARKVARATDAAMTNNFLYSQLIRDCVELGTPEEAESFAGLLPRWVHRDLGLRQLASELAKRGELEEALTIAQEEVSEKSREAAAAEVAIACAGAARIEDTETALKEVSDAAQRDRAYVTLAEALARAGRLAEAEKAAANITDPQQKLRAQATIERNRASGLDAKALEARLAEVATREEKLALYEQFVEKLIAEERIAEADDAIKAMIAVIKENPRPAERSKFGDSDDRAAIAYAKSHDLAIVRQLAKRGDKAEARRRIESVEEAALQLPPESGIVKMMLLTQVAAAQIEVGDLDGARQMIGQIKEEFPRSSIAAQLAAAFATAGDTAAALEMVALVGKDRRSRGTYLQPVVKELILANHLDAAKQVLAGVGDSAEEAEAYRAAGRAMLETDRGQELYDWLPDIPSDVARAFACIGAAEGLKPPQSPRSPKLR